MRGNGSVSSSITRKRENVNKYCDVTISYLSVLSVDGGSVLGEEDAEGLCCVADGCLHDECVAVLVCDAGFVLLSVVTHQDVLNNQDDTLVLSTLIP